MGVDVFVEDDLLPISALQHLLYCERQCVLIHLERLWAENRFTVEGRHLHERADSGKRQMRPGRKTTRAMPLWSYALGLFGKADIVEFHDREAEGGLLPAIPFPVEYKRGKPKAHDADRVQLCAQAMCLEEMLGMPVAAGALFYGRTRRRQDVLFDAPLRDLTRRAAQLLHEMLASGSTPAPVYEKKKCGRCSLASQCLPRVSAGRAAAFIDRQIRELLVAAGPVSE